MNSIQLQLIVMVTKDLERLYKMFDSFTSLIKMAEKCSRFKPYKWDSSLLIMITPFFFSFIIRYVIALVAIAFYTLIERKFLGYFQLRKGPNKVGLAGIPQPFADAIKLFVKEQSTPISSNRSPFIVAPILGLILTLILWAIYPHSNAALFITYGVLYFLCVSRINVYSTFIAGWCSNSKYALLGALRGVAQTISYEVRISLILLSALIIHNKIDISIIGSNTL